MALVTLSFYPITDNGFIWDDDVYILNNRHLNSVEGLRRIWFDLDATPQYYPLVFTSFWVENHLWGHWPTGYLLINMSIHAASALLLWWLLTRLGLPGAYLAALVFALHPVQVESVAWATERKNTLSLLFYLLSALSYFAFLGRHGRGIGDGGQSNARRKEDPVIARLYWTAAFGCFILALLSKTVTVSLPAAILLVIWWKRGGLTRGDVAPLIPFFLVGIPLGLLTVHLEETYVGASGLEWSMSPIERVMVAGRAIWFYAGKLICPAEICFIYRRWVVDQALWWQYLFPVGVLVVLAVLWLARRRMGRGPLVAVIIFCGTLVPALGFFDVYPHRYSYVANHFQYHASIPFLALIVTALVTGQKRYVRNFGVTAKILAAFGLALLGGLSWYHVQFYKNQVTLWKQTVACNPTAWIAHNNLGKELASLERYREALASFHRALDVRTFNGDLAKTHYNIGYVLLKQGQTEGAARNFFKALELNPNQRRAHAHLGQILTGRGNLDRAIYHYELALLSDPHKFEIYNNLGALYGMTGQLGKAEMAVQQALTIIPDSPQAQANLRRIRKLREKKQKPPTSQIQHDSLR